MSRDFWDKLTYLEMQLESLSLSLMHVQANQKCNVHNFSFKLKK